MDRNRGHVDVWLTGAFLVVLVMIVIAPQFWSDFPWWGKILYVAAGVAALGTGYFLRDASRWPKNPTPPGG
jgi:hypothetical protein